MFAFILSCDKWIRNRLHSLSNWILLSQNMINSLNWLLAIAKVEIRKSFTLLWHFFIVNFMSFQSIILKYKPSQTDPSISPLHDCSVQEYIHRIMKIKFARSEDGVKRSKSLACFQCITILHMMILYLSKI